MRLVGKELTLHVKAVPNPLNPIRIRGGGLTFCLTEAEAIDLASKLADVVDEIHHEGTQP